MPRRMLTAALMAAFTMAGAAQDPGANGTELELLKARMDRIEAENRELRASNETLQGSVRELTERVAAQDGSRLETEINALILARRFETVVNSAANPVTLWGEFRFRGAGSIGENRAGILDEEHDGWWVDSLIRLGFQYDFAQDVTAYAELQGHWAFGDRASTEGLSGPIFLPGEPTTPVRVHQAWIEIRNVFGLEPLSTRLGRQEILLGRQFQFGNAEWFNGFSFDAIRWTWDDTDFTASAFAAKLSSADSDLNQLPTWFLPHDDDELFRVYATLKVIENHEIDLYWIYINGHGLGSPLGGGASTGSQGTIIIVGAPFGGTAYYHTVGARFGGVFPGVAGGLDWNVEGAYQFGDATTGAGADQDVDAGVGEAELGLTIIEESRLRVFGRFLWADEDYIVLYGTRHFNDDIRARYGIHDLFPMFDALSFQLGLHFDPGQAWTLGATVLWAQADGDLGFIRENDDYGWEFDLWAEYRHSDRLVIGAGTALVFPDRALEGFLPVDDTQVFIYLQARLLF